MSGNQTPLSRAAPPHIQLVSMPQLAEAKTSHDDWTGKTDAAARRRAQTRLNTRAYRKRKAEQARLAAVKTTSTTGKLHTETTVTPEPLVPYWDDTQRTVSLVPASSVSQVYNPRASLLTYRSASSSTTNPPAMTTTTTTITTTTTTATTITVTDTCRNISFPLSSDHLITLLQFNAIRALSVNRTLLSGILSTPLDCDIETNEILPFPSPDKLPQIPPSLLPTKLQQTIPHPGWIDLFPLPEGRDAMILARINGSFDEDELWSDCIGGLYEGYPDDEMENRGFIAWSPPWDVSGWEMSEGFVEKWGRLLFGGSFGLVLEATNRWRVGRGDEVIVARVEEVM